jgi:hypothetical protein
VAADKTAYGIEKERVESLVSSAHDAFAAICGIGRNSHGITFGILGRIKGTPELIGYGTYEVYKYRSDDKIKEKARVIQYQITSNEKSQTTRQVNCWRSLSTVPGPFGFSRFFWPRRPRHLHVTQFQSFEISCKTLP